MSDLVEVFRKALMEAHADDWEMDTVSEAAHICARAALAAHDQRGEPDELDLIAHAKEWPIERINALSARADRGTAGLSSKRTAALVADLTSALRRQRDGEGLVRRQVERRDYRIASLERELAEARGNSAKKSVLRATAEEDNTDG
jgi:hypothetical protein